VIEMADDEILVDRPEAGVLRLTLNRPETLNAFTWSMYARLIELLRALRHDTETRVVILTGQGRGFCSGHDLKGAGKQSFIDPDSMSRPYMSKHSLTELGSIPVLMRTAPQPIICAVNGTTAGLGYALALASDMTLAAKSAKFVNSFHNAATGHELGVSYMLPRAVGAQRAAEILLTSRPVPAEEAERIGLVLRAVPDEKLMDEALTIARSIMQNVPLGIWLTKQSLWLNQNVGSLEAAIELENRAIPLAQSTADAAEKRAAFLEKRPPVFGNK
jgi:enoyl-CoA hydratase